MFAYLAFISITGEQTSQSLVMLGCAALGLLGFIQTSKQRNQRALRSKPLQHHIPTPLRYRPLVADEPDTLWGHAIVLGTPRTRHPDMQPTVPLHSRKQLQRP
ncbi:LPXTG cell wall anchor domain-containing protein [Streptomyces murinus]|uniref:LPXTG cell wall anchor domain-containing protein n=1 Tax=Streptomyces murinus TaxID=33900 RepID=UPI003F453939